jgi:hypothetical protein
MYFQRVRGYSQQEFGSGGFNGFGRVLPDMDIAFLEDLDISFLLIQRCNKVCRVLN